MSLINPQISGGNFQFNFLAQYGFNYNVLSTTNLANGNWVTNSFIYGDGNTHYISVPSNTAAQQFFCVLPQ